MRVTLKLFAMLSDYLPVEGAGGPRKGSDVTLELPEGTTVQAVIERFNLPSRLVHLVLVNGVYIAPQARAAHRLKADDELAVWPPIAGG
jgi:sulfur carrier protein ThiS